MSHSQNSSEMSPSAQEDNDLMRLHSIWKNIKNSKEPGSGLPAPPSLAASHKSVSSVRKAIQQEERKNLEMRLEMTEKQLMKARENTALLMKKLSQAEERNQFIEFQLEKEAKENQEKTAQIQELRAQLKEGRYASSNTFGKEKNSKQKQRENIQKQAKELSEINELKKRLEFKEKEIDRFSLKIKSLELTNKNMETELQSQTQLAASLRSKLTSAQTAMNQLYFSEQSKGAQLLQLQQAKRAIERLVLLLKKSQQYGRLGGWMEGQAFQIRYLNNMPKKIRAGLNQKKKCCSCAQIRIDEKLLWTPSICYKSLLNLKIKHSSTLTQDCIQEILFQLNKLYVSREQTSLLKQKQHYESELSKWRKKGQERYDELVARKQIQRLKKQISQSKFGGKKGTSNSSGDQLETLRKIGQYEDQLRLKMKEIKLLQQRIKLMETQTSNYDKVLYLEGAMWILDKLIAQLQFSQSSLLQFQTSFRDATTSLPAGELWLPYFKDFFERMQEENAGLVSKLEGMKDSTLRKMGRAGGKGEESIAE